MALDEVEREVGQRARVVGALARPRVRHLGPGHRQPVGVHVVLLLELAFERVQHVGQRERAHRRPRDAVHRRREHAVHHEMLLGAVHAGHQVRRRFCAWKKKTVSAVKIRLTIVQRCRFCVEPYRVHNKFTIKKGMSFHVFARVVVTKC